MRAASSFRYREQTGVERKRNPGPSTMATESASDPAAQRTLVDRLCATGGTNAAAVIETHISWVLLRDGCAYKIKKAVDLGLSLIHI